MLIRERVERRRSLISDLLIKKINIDKNISSDVILNLGDYTEKINLYSDINMNISEYSELDSDAFIFRFSKLDLDL